jgi:hypothetical protein
VYDASVLTFEDSALVDNYFRHATVDRAGSTLNATRTVFARNTKLTSEEAAIAVLGGGIVKLSQSAILDSVTSGIRVEDEGSRADVEESVIRRTSGKLADNGGLGVFAISKGVVNLVSSAVTDHPVLGVYSGKGGGTVTLSKSVLAGLPPGTSPELGRCAQAAETGHLDMTDTVVIGCPQSGIGLQQGGTGTFEHIYVKDARPVKDPRFGSYGGFGLLVEDGSTATVARSSFVDDSLAGMTSSGSTVTAEAVLIRGTKELEGLTAGSAVQVSRSGTMTVTRSAFADNTLETVLVTAGRFSMSASTVHGTTKSVDGLFGHGIAIFANGQIDLTDTAVYDSTGVGLIADGGEARVVGGTFARNQVAVHVQNGSSLAQSDDAGDLGSGEIRISGSTRFVDNATRVGSGDIPVSPPPLDP